MIDWESDHVLRTCKVDSDTLSALDWATKWVVLAKQRRFPCIFEGEPMTWAWWLSDLSPYLSFVFTSTVLGDAERRNEPDYAPNSDSPHYNAVAETIYLKFEQGLSLPEEREMAESWAAIHVETGQWDLEKQEDYLSHYPEEEPLSLGLEEEKEPLSLW